MELQTARCWARRCKHYRGVVGREHVCKAFPKGIPNEIAYGAAEHTRPRKGDGGTVFEEDPNFPETYYNYRESRKEGQ